MMFSNQAQQLCAGQPMQPCIFGKDGNQARTYNGKQCIFCDEQRLNEITDKNYTMCVVRNFMELSHRAQQIVITRVRDYYRCGHLSRCMTAKQRGQPAPSINFCPGNHQQDCIFGRNGAPAKTTYMRQCDTCKKSSMLMRELRSNPINLQKCEQLIHKLPAAALRQNIHLIDSPEIRQILLQTAPSLLSFTAAEWTLEECYAVGKTMWEEPLSKRPH